MQGESIISAQTDDPDVNRQLDGRLFMRVIVSNKTPYVREPVIVTYLLYNDNVALSGNLDEIEKPADTPGMMIDDPPLFATNRLTFQPLQLGGKQYNVAQVLRVVLTPTKAGSQSCGGFTAKLTIPVRRQGGNDPFPNPFMDDPFFGGGIKAILPSPQLELGRSALAAERPAGGL